MYKQEYEIMFRIEEKDWWFSTKRAIVFDQISRHFSPPAGARPRILDVGCGTGIVLARHAELGDAYGMDFMHDALIATSERAAGPLTRGSAVQIPFKGDTFDLVTCLDVLYHKNIASDAAAVSEIYRVLKPGGLFVLTDCALMCLWGKHDIAVEAARRYSSGQLRDVVEAAGFDCIKISYMNFFLLPFVFVVRKLSNLRSGTARSDVKESGALTNWILKAVYGSEKYLLRRSDLPLGSSIIAVCRKPSR